MLINLSNNSFSEWPIKQKLTAEQQFGQIIDLPFPPVLKEFDLDQVIKLVEQYVEKCLVLINKNDSYSKCNSTKASRNAIHIMGEMTFVYQFVKKMSEQGILCLASTSDMNNNEHVSFRPYTTDLF